MKEENCDDSKCTMALRGNCHCSCKGKNHATERWRNFYLVGKCDEYLLTDKLEIKWSKK